MMSIFSPVLLMAESVVVSAASLAPINPHPNEIVLRETFLHCGKNEQKKKG